MMIFCLKITLYIVSPMIQVWRYDKPLYVLPYPEPV